MDIETAIKILHHDTSFDKITEIEYYGGFNGKEKARDAIKEAQLLACEIMKKELNRPSPNTKQYYYNGERLWTYYSDDRCPTCGSNCFHKEYDGKFIYGICNGCDNKVYVIKQEYVDDNFKNGIWK